MTTDKGELHFGEVTALIFYPEQILPAIFPLVGKLKDWRRVATRYDRCVHTFFSAICIAAIVIFYLN